MAKRKLNFRRLFKDYSGKSLNVICEINGEKVFRGETRRDKEGQKDTVEVSIIQQTSFYMETKSLC